MIFVLGIDAATFRVIKPNLDRLPTFKRLCAIGRFKELVLKEKPVSPAIWWGCFAAKRWRSMGMKASPSEINW